MIPEVFPIHMEATKSLTKFRLRFTKDKHVIWTNKEAHSRWHVATIKILRPRMGQGEWTNEHKVMLKGGVSRRQLD